jgi:hypothetical protein
VLAVLLPAHRCGPNDDDVPGQPNRPTRQRPQPRSWCLCAAVRQHGLLALRWSLTRGGLTPGRCCEEIWIFECAFSCVRTVTSELAHFRSRTRTPPHSPRNSHSDTFDGCVCQHIRECDTGTPIGGGTWCPSESCPRRCAETHACQARLPSAHHRWVGRTQSVDSFWRICSMRCFTIVLHVQETQWAAASTSIPPQASSSPPAVLCVLLVHPRTP